MENIPCIYSTLNIVYLQELIVKCYSLPNTLNITFIKRGFNDTYIINYSISSKAILRVYKHGWKTHKQVESEISLINHLHQNNISVAYPIADKDGKFIQSIIAPEGVRHAVLFSYAEGQSIRKFNKEQAFLLGNDVAQIHQLTINKQFGSTAFNYDINKQFAYINSIVQPLLKDHPAKQNTLLALELDLQKVWEHVNPSDIKTGTCHGDLQAENFHINEANQITFFDFDFCGHGPLIYDIGVFIWYDHKNKSLEIIKSFLKGYQETHTLSSSEISLLPYYSTLRALFQMALYAELHDGKQLPVWPTHEISKFIEKTSQWHIKQKEYMQWL